MSQTIHISRRTFLKLGAAAGAGLAISVYLWPSKRYVSKGQNTRVSTAFSPPINPDLWIKIGSDGTVTVIVSRSEMGQGIATASAMLVAEELEPDWSKVRTEWAPADLAYANPHNGMQGTGASWSIRVLWEPLRKAGAIAREMLIQAAADKWGVNGKTCRADKGYVLHIPSGKRLNYGSVAARAAKLPIPRDVQLKDVTSFHIIGKRMHDLFSFSKITGAAVFGSDIKMPGMRVAMISRCPVIGGRVAFFDASRSQAIRGVHDAVEIPQGIAVIADNVWSAQLGRDALKVTWEEGPNKSMDTASIYRTLEKMGDRQGTTILDQGNTARAMRNADSKIESAYLVPYLAHAPMDPLSCTAYVTDTSCDLWVPTQNHTKAHNVAAQITGLPRSSVKVHSTLLGSAFGRGQIPDYIAEAVEIAKHVGKPIKLLWSREDDIHHDFYRPATYSKLSAGLNAQGWPIAWFHRIAGLTPSVWAQLSEGAHRLPYAIKNIHTEYVNKPYSKLQNIVLYPSKLLKGQCTYNIPAGPWRSVAHSQNAFTIESFIDELAMVAHKDPYEYRRHLLRNSPRGRGVIDLAASKAGWGKTLQHGHYAGMAYHEMAGSRVAQVVDLSVEEDGTVVVHRVVCAVDCGIVVNPDTVEAQMEGCIVFGLTAALKGEITISNGRVEQSNFHDYELLRMDEVPKVEVYIVPSKEAPGGIGEVGVPPIAPAITNAVFAATGKRVRRLPVRTLKT